MPALRSALLVAVLLVASAAMAVPAAASDDGAHISKESFTVHQGDTVAVQIAVPAGTEATLRLQRTPNAVTARAVVADDGDGQITAVLNTYTGNWTVRGNDSVVSRRGPTDPPLRVGPYDIGVDAGESGASADLTVQERSLDRLTTWRAGNGTGLERPGAIREAIDRGRLDRAERLNGSDSLVLQLDASGLEGALATDPGENATQRFRSVVRQHGRLSITQSYPPPSRQRLHLQVLRGPGTTVIPDPENDTYYLLVDMSTVSLMRGDDEDTDVDLDDVEFEATVELAAESNLTDTREHVRAVVADRDAALDTEPDGRIHLFPGRGQRISGPTNVGTGWNVTVVVRGHDDTSTSTNESFVRRTTATVNHSAEDADRSRFAATVDLSETTPGTTITVDVRFENESLLDASITGRVADTSASLEDVSVVRGPFGRLELTATLARGGFVVLHEDSPTGAVVGATDYLEPGATDVTVYVNEPTNASTIVAVAHADSNHNEWFDGPTVDEPYATRATASVDSATLQVEPSTTTTPTNTTTTTTPENSSVTPYEPPRTGTGVPVPALGVGPTLVVVVGATLLLALRAHD